MVDELEAVEALIAEHPEGIRRPELERAFAERYGTSIHWRTLLRRLNRLIHEARVRSEGESTARIYLPGPALFLEAPPAEAGYVPISREGARLRALVRRPVVDRPPVGYDTGFLERYVPGETWYLPEGTRARLHEMGRTPDAERPAGTYAREIFGRLLIDLAWASSRLEGNTYSRLDTLNLIKFGQEAEGRDATEAQMILNHKAAIEFMVEQVEEIGFNKYTFMNLHAALSENLLSDPQDEGRLRSMLVNVTGTTYQPLGIPQKIAELFELILDKADAIPDPFEQSFFTMVHIPYLQPFADVNKRTSRLGANLSLIRHNLCPLSFVDVPEKAYVEGTLAVYEHRRVDLLRDVYTWAYERSCAQYRVVREALGEPDLFRLRHRTLLNEAVRETILSGAAPREEVMREWAIMRGVPEHEVPHFARMGLELLVSLHEGALARYGLRPSQFNEWKAKYRRRDRGRSR